MLNQSNLIIKYSRVYDILQLIYYRLTYNCGYAKIWQIMKLFTLLLKLKKQNQQKTLADYQRELLVKLGGQEFKKLHDLGINIPIALG